MKGSLVLVLVLDWTQCWSRPSLKFMYIDDLLLMDATKEELKQKSLHTILEDRSCIKGLKFTSRKYGWNQWRLRNS